MSKKNLDFYYTIIASNDRVILVQNVRNLDENYLTSQPQQTTADTKKFDKIHKPIPSWLLEITWTWRIPKYRYENGEEVDNFDIGVIKCIKIVNFINKNKK